MCWLTENVEGFSLQAWLGPGAHMGRGTALGFIGSAVLRLAFLCENTDREEWREGGRDTVAQTKHPFGTYCPQTVLG